MLCGVLLLCLSLPCLSDVSIAAGGHVTCALSSGWVRCWGWGSLGQLGQEDPVDLMDASRIPAVSLGSGRAAQQVAVGKEHVCARLSDDSVACWGYGPNGQLGGGAVTQLGARSHEMGDNLVPVDLGNQGALQVVAGDMQSCAKLVDGSLKCWGKGLLGAHGQGTTANVGDDSGEMGESLQPVVLGQPVQQVAAGTSHTCALLEDGAVKCWGAGAYGQLGQGSRANVGDSPGEMANLPAIDLGTGAAAVEVVAGRGFTCARLLGNAVKCWGFGSNGQLGSGSSAYIGDDALEMGDALLPLDFGPGRSALALAAGEDHACARLDDESVRCWGKNDYGQLGQGHTRSIGDEPGEMGENLPPVNLGSNRSARAIAAGSLHSCAILDDNSVKCWGYGAHGQLGNGGTASLGDDPSEMGDNLPVSFLFSSYESTSTSQSPADAPATMRFLQPTGSCCDNASNTTKSPCELFQAYLESVFTTQTTTSFNNTFQTARMTSEEKRTITFASMGVVGTLLMTLLCIICCRWYKKRRKRLEQLAEEAAIREMLSSDEDDTKVGSAGALAAAAQAEAAPVPPPSLECTLRPEQLEKVPAPATEPKKLPAPGGLSPCPSEAQSVRSGPVPPPAKASVPSPRPPPARSPRPAPPKPPDIKLPNYMSEEC